MNNKIFCIIQARTGSTRFSRKVLEQIDGSAILLCVVKRLRYASLIPKENILIATTTKREDDEIVKIAKEVNVKFFRGSENDVLDRYYKASKECNAGIILRITADCPLIDYKIIDRVIETFMNNRQIDYCSNRLKPSYPEGLDTEVFSFEALKRAWQESKGPRDREHVTPYIYRSKKFKTKNVSFKENLSFLHFSVDYKKDFEFVKEIYKSLYDKGDRFVLNDIIKLFIDRPEILKINQAGSVYSKFLKYTKKIKASKKGSRV